MNTRIKGAAPDQESAPSKIQSPHENHTTINDEKLFSTLRARFALAGHILSRSNPVDGEVAYFSRRWGMCREFKDLAAVAAFLELIGG